MSGRSVHRARGASSNCASISTYARSLTDVHRHLGASLACITGSTAMGVKQESDVHSFGCLEKLYYFSRCHETVTDPPKIIQGSDPFLLIMQLLRKFLKLRHHEHLRAYSHSSSESVDCSGMPIQGLTTLKLRECDLMWE